MTMSIQEMIRLDKAGVRRFEIARRAGINPSRVSKMLISAGRPSLFGTARPTKIDAAALCGLHEAGLTDSELAVALGCCRSTAATVRARCGLAANPLRKQPPRTALTALEKRVLNMFDRRMSYADIGAKIGKSKNAVAGIICRARAVLARSS